MRDGDSLLRCCPPQWKAGRDCFGSRADSTANKLSMEMARKRKSGFIPEEGTAEGGSVWDVEVRFPSVFSLPSIPLCILVILPESSFLTQ